MVAVDLCKTKIDDDAALLLLIVKEVARFDIAMVDTNLLQTFKPDKQF